MNYITVTQLSERWKVSPCYIQNLCRDKRIPGAIRMGKLWMLPDDVERPADNRRKSIAQANNMPVSQNEICWSVMGAAYRIPGTANELIKSLAYKPEAAMLTKAQFAYLNGDIDACASLSEELFICSDDFEIKLGSAFLKALCALYNGDVDGWIVAGKQLETLSCPNSDCNSRKELWLAVYGASIYDMSGYPDWFKRGCFTSLPAGYYPAAFVHYIKYIYIRGDAMLKKQPTDSKDFNGQLYLLPAICEPLISRTVLDKAIVSEIYLRLFCASSYHHAGEDGLAIEHIDRAISIAMPDRIYAPFAEQRLNLDSLIDNRLKAISPNALDKVRSLNVKLMDGWSVVHNRVLGRNHTTELTAKELEAARLAVFGLTNIEIASRMGISVNTVKRYLQTAKDKTGAKKRSELAEYV